MGLAKTLKIGVTRIVKSEGPMDGLASTRFLLAVIGIYFENVFKIVKNSMHIVSLRLGKPSKNKLKSLEVTQVQGCVGDGVCVMLCDDAV